MRMSRGKKVQENNRLSRNRNEETIRCGKDLKKVALEKHLKKSVEK